MVDIFSADSSGVFAAQDQSGQRAQLAQYAILKAAQFMRDQRQDDAIRAFQQALAFDPQNTTALSYIGNINLARNHNAEAIKAFATLARMQPNSADAQMTLGNAYLQDKQYAESEKAYQKAASIDKTNPLPVYTLGMQYLHTDRLKEAETQFLEVQRMVPGDGNVYYGLGSLYNKQGKYEDAVKNLKTALELKPNFPDARYELGFAYSKLDRPDDALSQLKTLANDNSPYASDLSFVLNKPQMVSMEVAPNSPFNLVLGAQTPLWSFDASYLTPDTSNVVSINIQFDRQMDPDSVTNLNNWSIGKAKGGVAGYYNNTLPVAENDVTIAKTPLSVSYNSYTGQATVSFMLNQNATADATIDPRHLVFKFTGQDAYGRTMDSAADEIDGAAGVAF